LWRSVHEFLALGESSPYKYNTADSFPSVLISTAGRLIHTWIRFILWNSLRRILAGGLHLFGNTKTNMPQLATSEMTE
jgi:hypothetical protein